MANNSFFKFLFGFVAIIGLSLVVAYVADAYSNGGGLGDIGDLIANFFR